MLREEENQELTRVGPGTPAGEMLRRYWYPIAPSSEMKQKWSKRVRLLGEDLVLYRDRKGRLGLLEERCAHRRASLHDGIPTEDGLRCPYHGWLFDSTGQCIDQPNEPESSKFKERVKIKAYQVEELGGFIFAYMGPLPAPLLPRYDGFVVDNAIRMIGWALVPSNWLQIMENSADPVHTEWLHGHLQEWVEEKAGEKNKYAFSRKHLKIRFPEFQYGMMKQRLLAGHTEESDDWTIGHPIVFPNMLAVGNGDEKSWRAYAFQIRVPIDDTHTMHYWYTAYVAPQGIDVPRHLLDNVAWYEVVYRNAEGEYALDCIDAQDIYAWITQGPIADRTQERLGTTDQGIITYRNMVRREIDKVARGEDPMNVFRDPAKNAIHNLPLERNKHHYSDGLASLVRRTHARFSPIADEVCKVFATVDKGQGAKAKEHA